jgi:6-phosphogluconolactonase
MPEWRIFASSAALADALADDVAEVLARALRQRGTAFLAVSGGTTPAAFLDTLSRRDIAWKDVLVTLVDERCVPEDSPRFNAALVRRHLLKNKASEARFLPLLVDGSARPEEAADIAEAELARAPWPLDAVILGMGSDGHTASIFADADNRAELLDLTSRRRVLAVRAESAGEPRLTLPLARLLEAAFLALHIEGKEKRRTLKAALDPLDDRPITWVFRHAGRPPLVYWAP